MGKNQSNSALLIMDMQLTILNRLSDTSGLISNTKKAIAAAREKKIPVIYVVIGFRPGAPEISTNNKSFTASKATIINMNLDEMIKIHPELIPQPGEITVTKKRYSALRAVIWKLC